MTAEDAIGLLIPITFFLMLATEWLFKTGRTFRGGAPRATRSSSW